MANSRIGILGTGDVGRALGKGFIARGHAVTLGSRNSNNEKATAWAKEAGPLAKAGTFSEASRDGEVIVLATLWTGTKAALEQAGPESFKGKVVIDATNPLAHSGGAVSLAIGHHDSGGEQVQRWLPGARVVKAFNSVGNVHMVDPKFAGGPPTMFIAGDDAEAKKTVTDILTSFGWETLDAGPLTSSRYLEPLCMLWVGHGIASGGWHHAFKMLK